MSAGQRRGRADLELDAIRVILSALEPLDGDSIQRVLDYVFGRLSISRTTPSPLPLPVGPSTVIPTKETSHPGPQSSIRDLKEEKQPAASNQMAALVAYYLSEIAPENERKGEINASDLERYFKQARFKLPKAISQALPNAAAAGYFDSTGNGLYRLNPVGYNLVVHGLPRIDGNKNPSSKRPKKKSRVKSENKSSRT